MNTQIDELQILALSRQGLSPAEIADSLNYDPAAVSYVLARNGQTGEIPEDDFLAIKRRLLDIAKDSDDDGLAARVGMFLWERQKGAVKDMRNAPAINISELNLLMTSANSFIHDFRSQKNSKDSDARRIEGVIEAPPPTAAGSDIGCSTEHEETGHKP